MLLKIYQALGYPLAPIIRAHTIIRSFSGKEGPKRLAERRGISSTPRPDAPIIWVHGASVGESNAVRPLIQRLLDQYPNHHILLTTVTKTSANLIAGWGVPRLIHQYLPYDLLLWVRHFLKFWQPTLVLFAESELWPTTLLELKRQGIPTVLLNGRLSKTSYSRWSKAPKSIQVLLESFALIYVPNQEQTERFQKLGAPKLKLLPNLKFAAPPLPCDPEIYETLRSQIGDRLVFVAASLHPEDYAPILDLYREILVPNNVLTILVPRHPNKVSTFDHIEAPRQSHAAVIDNKTDLYIADTFGELGLWYSLADIVYIGGSSTAKMGGHNPLEPARLGCAIQFGVGMKSFSDIADALVQQDAAFCTKTPQMHFKNTLDMIKNTDARYKMADTAATIANQQQSILDRILDDLKPYLEKSL